MGQHSDPRTDGLSTPPPPFPDPSGTGLKQRSRHSERNTELLLYSVFRRLES